MHLLPTSSLSLPPAAADPPLDYGEALYCLSRVLHEWQLLVLTQWVDIG